MRISIALSLVAGFAILAPAAVSAAPLALSDHIAMTKSVGTANAGVEQVGSRRQTRRCGRRNARCTWSRTPYWRPYQYYNWQYYYPYGGPLF
jgi:hypothetical protein